MIYSAPIFYRLDFNSIRSILNYVSLFVITTATYIILCKHGRLKSNVCGALYTSSKMSFLAFLNTSFFILGYTIKQLLKIIK